MPKLQKSMQKKKKSQRNTSNCKKKLKCPQKVLEHNFKTQQKSWNLYPNTLSNTEKKPKDRWSMICRKQSLNTLSK